MSALLDGLGWTASKLRALQEGTVGKPEWLQGGLVGWNEYNPLYHAYYWLDSDETKGFSQDWLSGMPELKQKVLDAWNAKFWVPVYAAVCGMSLPDYNNSLIRVKPKIKQIADAYGPEFIASWYVASGETIGVEEYVRRRAELGCSVPPYVPSDLQPAPDTGVTSPPPLYARQYPWGWIALFGATAILGVALTYQLKGKKKKRRKKGRRR